MLIDTYMKFREDSLNGFEVTEWTQFCDSPRDITPKSIKPRIMVLALCTSSNVD